MKITKQSPRKSIVLSEATRVSAVSYNTIHLASDTYENNSKDIIYVTITRGELEELIKRLDNHGQWLKDNYNFKGEV